MTLCEQKWVRHKLNDLFSRASRSNEMMISQIFDPDLFVIIHVFGKIFFNNLILMPLRCFFFFCSPSNTKFTMSAV